MVLHGSLSDCKYPRVSRILLGIFADLNNAIVRMVIPRALISKYSNSIFQLLENVPKAPITICCYRHPHVPSLFNSLTRYGYLSHFLFYERHTISFQTFLYGHLKLSYTLENSVSYCYISYKMTDQFLWFQVQMNSYSRNSNTPN